MIKLRNKAMLCGGGKLPQWYHTGQSIAGLSVMQIVILWPDEDLIAYTTCSASFLCQLPEEKSYGILMALCLSRAEQCEIIAKLYQSVVVLKLQISNICAGR